MAKSAGRHSRPYDPTMPPTAPPGVDLPLIEANLRRHVDLLAGVIGERNLGRHPGGLEGAARYVEDTLRSNGLTPVAQPYEAAGQYVRNIEATIIGSRRPAKVWVLGAHYDSAPGTPGADDNASAVAGLLEAGRLLAAARPRDTVRLVAFANEEPPFYKSAEMGSLVCAKACRARGDDIVGMVNLEMIGYFTPNEPQRYPAELNRKLFGRLLRDRGDFIGFVGNLRSFVFARRCNALFRKATDLPSVWAAGPAFMGADMSDHWSFWEQGYRAVMVTDTSFFRNPHYHRPTDLPETLDYPAMAKVTAGVVGVMRGLAGTA
ncbi:MAG: peptidase [Phycisphaerales bacterium]|nr:peptidase [Phycisphaerales bacterium]